MASLVAGSNSDRYFPVGILEEHVYTVPPMTIENLVARLQVTVTMVDANILRHVQ